jgi:RNA polymerase sigma-70 factor, ECF subfamily
MTGAAFHQLWESHSAAVQRFALYLTGSPDEAEEVTSETFLRAWTAKTEVRASTARGYLMAIARHLVVDERRRRKRHPALPEEGAGPLADPDQALELRRTLERVAALGEQYSVPLLLSAIAGLTYQEIASQLGLPLATVKIRIHRARLKLAAGLEQKGDNR